MNWDYLLIESKMKFGVIVQKRTEFWDVEKKEPYITVDNEKWKSQYEIIMDIPWKIQTRIPYDPTIPPLGIYLKNSTLRCIRIPI